MKRKKIALFLIASSMGTWLTVDSVIAITSGSYIGSSTGGWAAILEAIGIDPVDFAPGLLSLGLLWLVSALAALLGNRWWKEFYITTASLSIWYIPFGTLLSLVSLVIILSNMLPRQFQRRSILIAGIITSIIVTLALMSVLNLQGSS